MPNTLDPRCDTRPGDFGPAIRKRETEPRPAYVIVTIDHPSRRRDRQEHYVHTVRVEDYDPEHQTPLSYALAAIENDEIRARLRGLEDGHEDWYVTVWSDDRVVFDGHPYHAIREIERVCEAELRALVNP